MATRVTSPGAREKLMGDKSPKAVKKQAQQQQAKAKGAQDKKKQAAAAKQVPGKK